METDFGNKTKMCDELKNTVHKTKTEMSNSFVISAMWDHVVESVRSLSPKAWQIAASFIIRKGD